MTSTANLPQIEETAKFLADLLGSAVKASECTDFAADKVVALGNYTDHDNTTQQFVACDIAAAAILGAALTGVPPAMVKETVSAGTVPENLLENLQEVMNIAANLFPQSEKQRIVLEEVFADAKAAESFSACEDTPKICMTIEVPRYGEGVVVIGAT